MINMPLKKTGYWLRIISLLTICSWLCACTRKLLSEPVASDLQSPSTLAELAPLFNNEQMSFTPGLSDLMADNLYIKEGLLSNYNKLQQNAYEWKADLYAGDTGNYDYELCAAQVMNANFILEQLQQIPFASDSALWKSLKGMALFYRSWGVYNMAQLFAPAYDSLTADADIGVPLRQTASVSEKAACASMRATYKQVIDNIQEAIPLLPVFDIANNELPSQAAAYGMLARVYCSMNNYTKAALYADKCLRQYNTLLNYNRVTSFSKDNNPEIIFKTHISDKVDVLKLMKGKASMADTLLFALYSANDLRRSLLFEDSSGYPAIRKGYDGFNTFFSGLATDEIWLIRAESRARNHDITGALSDLNTLLEKRYQTNTFIPVTAATEQDAIDLIIQERRKELPYRALRWTDLRRLNKLNYGITVKRIVANNTYILEPGDARYAIPFPPGAMH
jgi:tetratricopeptide (TPR) repeat protein